MLVAFAVLTHEPTMVLRADGWLLEYSGELMAADDVAVRIAPDDPRTMGSVNGAVPAAVLMSSLE